MHPNHPAPAEAGSRTIPLDYTLPPQLRGPELPAEVLRRASGRALPEHCRDISVRSAAMTLLGCLWQRLLADFRAGIEISEEAGSREVSFLRIVTYRIDTGTGEIDGFATLADGERQSALLSVGQWLARWHWVNAMLDRHIGLLEACRPPVTQSERNRPKLGAHLQKLVRIRLEGIWSWAKRCVEELFRRHLDWRELRRQISRALALDPGQLALARRVMRPNRQNLLTNRIQNDYLRHQHQIERVAKLAPALLPALGWLISQDRIAPDDRVFSVLKRALREQGVSPADWRRLLVDPAKPVWRVVGSGKVSEQSTPMSLLALWAKVHRGLSPDESLPDALWRSILRTGAEPLTDRLGEPETWAMPPGLLSAGLARARESIAQGRFPEFIDDEWLPVLSGYTYEDPYRLSSRLRRWPAAVHRALDASKLALAKRRSTKEAPWPVPMEHFVQDGLEAHFLRSEGEVVAEGIAMRHCAAALAGECREGKLLLASIREQASGHRVATVGFRRSKPWHPWSLEDVKGFANRTVPKAVRTFAEDLDFALPKRPAPTLPPAAKKVRLAGTRPSSAPAPASPAAPRDGECPSPYPDQQLPEDPHRLAALRFLRLIMGGDG